MKKVIAAASAALLAATLCACTGGSAANNANNTANANTSNATNEASQTQNANANTTSADHPSPAEGYVYQRTDSKGDHFYNAETGTGLYVNWNGSIEVADADGVIWIDDDADGIYDTSSPDGGATWVDVSGQNRTWK